MGMEVQQLRPGLWRWTAPHPDWTPAHGAATDGWQQMVGCLYYEAPDAVVLIDPLAPPAGTPDHDRFWRALDYDVQRLNRPVEVLLGNQYHDRSAQAVCDRYHQQYRTSIRAHRAAQGHVDCRLTYTFGEGDALPGGVRAYSVAGLTEDEVVFYLPACRALAIADAVIGAGNGQLRVAPPAWTAETDEALARYREQFRPSLRRLLDLPIDLVVTSHGQPVLEHGHRALAAALDGPAWGE